MSGLKIAGSRDEDVDQAADYMVAVAGMVAESIAFGDFDRGSALADERRATPDGRPFPERLRHYLRTSIRERLQERWPAVEALANTLSGAPVTLSGDEAEQIIEAALEPFGVGRFQPLSKS